MLLAPAGLIALAAVLIPLLIHLLSRSRGERVLVGNIELYRQVQRQRVNQLKVVQWLLLLLRILLVVFGALVLAMLARQGLAPLEGDTAYITEARLAAAEAGTQALDDAPENRVTLTGGWPQLAEALATREHLGEVTVYTLASAQDQPPEALALPREVTWNMEGAGETATPTRLRVVIAFDENRQGDARLLAAALDAVDQPRALIIEARLMPTGDLSDQEADALIWLSTLPGPGWPSLKTFIREQAPSQSPDPALMTVADWPGLRFRPGDFPDQGQGTNDRSDTTIGNSRALWRDASGAPMLSEYHGAGNQRDLVFHFPLSLTADGALARDIWPDTLARLILGEALWESGTGDALVLGQKDNPPQTLLKGPQPARSMVPWLLLLMAGVFLLERWLAERPLPGSRARPSPGEEPAHD